jgi:HEPN domain-containing protein
MARTTHHGISEQARAGKHRRDDAQALMNSNRWRGAMYMAGYAVECLLKTKLMQKFDCRNLRELEEELQRRGLLASPVSIDSHGLELLLKLTGGMDRLRSNPTLLRSFNTANRWVPAWRYNPDLSNSDDAEAFLEAIDLVLHWVEDNV